MPEQNVHVVQEVGSLEDAFNALAKLQKTLRYLLAGNLDFENIRARSIKAENIEVGTLTAEEIAANSITADRMNVNELSAISADLGHITAGLIEAVQIFGSYIATRMVGYPRCEMSNTEDLFAAYGTAGQHIKMFANGMVGNTPVMMYSNGTSSTTQAQTIGSHYIQSNGEVVLQAPSVNLYGSVRLNNGGPLGLYGQSYSSASEVSEIVSDFNILLSNLKAMKVIA